MKIAGSNEMREIDRGAIEGFCIPGLVLMERAGLAVSRRAKEFGVHKVTVLCGSGNNGGDGIVAARELYNSGYNVRVIMAGKKNALSGDCGTQYSIARKMGVPIEFRKAVSTDFHGAIAVDALFGTGLKKAITGPIAETITTLNKSGVPVVSVDMPSGVSADTGEIMGVAVKAACTVTFGLPKRGHFLYPGAGHVGELLVEDIGFPAGLLSSDKLKCSLIESEEAARLIPERRRYSHKGDYGHVLIVAGSRGKTGAALMAARACLRAGAGLVSIGIPESLTGSFQSSVLEEMLLPLPDTGNGTLSKNALDKILSFLHEKADVLALGPGIGTETETVKLVNEIVLRCASPMVIDADGINALRGKTAIFGSVKAPVVLTPHPGELSRLTGWKISEIEKDRIGAASGFSKRTGVVLVFKGVPTVIAEPSGDIFISRAGNPGMAKAGTGDVLTGIVSSLLGQGLSPLDASVLGVYLHSLSGDVAAEKRGENSLLSSDIIESIPEAFKTARRI